MDKMDMDGCGSNYALSKLNSDPSEFTCYELIDSGTKSRIDRVYTDIKITNNTKINQIMVSFTDHYNAISLDRPPSKN